MSITRTTLTILILSFLFNFVSTSCYAYKKVLKVAFSEAPPVKMLNQQGKPSGVDIELVQRLTSRLGFTIKFVFVPFNRALHLLQAGKIDLMTGVLRRPDREKYLHFIEPAYKKHSDKVFFVLRGNEHLIKSHQDLHSLRVATVLGVKYYPHFDNDNNIDKEQLRDGDLSFKMLAANRVKVAISSEYSGDYRVARLGLGDKLSKAQYAYRKEQNVYMVLSKKSKYASQLPHFSRALNNLLEEGVYKDIKKEFIRAMADASNEKQSLK